MAIRAGTFVRLNTKGAELYPRFSDKVGRLDGYDEVAIARVHFGEHVEIILDCYLEPYDAIKEAAQGKITSAEAGRRLGVSKQRANKKMHDRFPDIPRKASGGVS